jgi:aldehyde:ferredoxin oxidoreductase
MTGFTGKTIEVDLATGEIGFYEIEEELYRRFIGGAGLASKIYYDRVPPEVEWDDPENLLIVMNGLLTGSSFPGTGRFSMATRSPLTNLWGEGNCGGSFGAALRHAGYDGIIFKGKSEKPVYLYIEGDSIELRDASGLWGKDCYETHEWLEANLADGQNLRSLSIGPAGENLVKIACLTNEIGSVIGRCGIGAVAGDKQLKTIAIRGGGKYLYHDAEKAKELSKHCVKKLKNSVLAGSMHEMGTNGAFDTGMLSGDVPTKNWKIGEWMDALDTLNSFYYNDSILVKIVGCYACSVRCKRVVKIDEGPYQMHEHAGPEYETVCMMGTNILNPSLEAVAKANDICNRLGVDTISMGAIIAAMMEAQELGLIDPADTGIDFAWGNMEAVMEAIRMTAGREGFGDRMAEGSLKLATELGAPELSVHVRGLDFPAHDPRGFHGFGLAYVMGTRGACHLNSTNLMAEGGMGGWPEIGLRGPYTGTVSKGKAEVTWKCMALGQIMNSMVMCNFIGAWLDLQDDVDMIKSATGWDDYTVEELMDNGWRIWYQKRLMLNAWGSGAQDDVLPPKALTPTEEGANQGSVPKIKKMRREYYELAQLDEEGRPLPEPLAKYGLA